MNKPALPVLNDKDELVYSVVPEFKWLIIKKKNDRGVRNILVVASPRQAKLLAQMLVNWARNVEGEIKP